MDSDDGLMLNLTSYNGDENTKKAGGPKAFHNRTKEHKKLQRSRNLNPHVVPRHSEFSEKKATISCSKKDGSTEESYKKRGSGKVQVISSLFRHNPTIPDVPRMGHDFQSLYFGLYKRRDMYTANDQEPSENRPLFSGEKFCKLPLSPYMISNLVNNLQMTTLTSVQKTAIPILLNGQDVFIKSKTGTGKTLCYAVPVVHSLQSIQPKIKRADGLYAMVLVPTRELALQSVDLLQKLVKPFHWIVPGYVMGGEKRKSEKARLRKGVNILVATPGRLLDHIEKTQCLSLKRIQWIVLDEADRLLDMGFEKDVSAILGAIKQQQCETTSCQTVLLSATLTKGVERLMDMSLHNPKFVDDTSLQDVAKGKISEASLGETVVQTPHQLKQFFVIVPNKLRLVSLTAFLLSKHKVGHRCKTIVFLSSRDSVDFHYSLLRHTLFFDEGGSVNLFKLHGNMSQKDRTDVFKKYSSSEEGVLFSTDVAARGLDLPRVSWIIQYDTPGSAVEYIHRVGRTARIGTEGQALLFLMPAEIEYLQTLAERNIRPEEVSVSNILETLLPSSAQVERQSKRKALGVHIIEDAATSLQMKFENHVLSNPGSLRAAKKAFQSFVRSYATFPASLKHIFHVNNLHLGHLAKAFAMRDAPSGMSGVEKGRMNNKTIKPTPRKRKLIITEEHSGDLATSGPRPGKRKKRKHCHKR